MRISRIGLWLVASLSLTSNLALGAALAVQEISPQQSVQNQKALLRYLWPVLKANHRAARVYYHAICQSNALNPIVFPPVDVQPASDEKTIVGTIRSIFANSKDISVTEDRSGMIRISIDTVSDQILNARIAVLKLNPIAQYNASLAIAAIENSQEMQAMIQKTRTSFPQRPFDMLIVQPNKKFVHLPEKVANLTVDKALDMVAATFEGVVFYGTCKNPSLFDIGFRGGVYFDDSWLSEP